jgi:polyribonucleotide nucleotidyltransferase
MEEIKLKFGTDDLIIQTGKLAKQANGAVTVQYGGTVVLVTCVMSKEPREETLFLPLTVEYQEKTYAAGRIPGGFFKREGRPTEKEILTARLIDRPLRPLFPKGLCNEIQIMAIVLSSDGENDPDVLGLIGASASLAISDIPFAETVGACRVGRVGDGFVLNPTYAQIEQGSLDIVVAANKNGVIMVEAGAKEVSEDLMLEAIDYGFQASQEIIATIEKLQQSCGKNKAEVKLKKLPDELKAMVRELADDKLKIIDTLHQKDQREEAIESIWRQLVEKIDPTGTQYTSEDIKSALIEVERERIRGAILSTCIRPDGRGPNQIRKVTCEVGVLPRTHGSSLFTRGQTQSLSVATLGTRSDQQMIEALEGETFKKFMLHYSFPPFSVGEVRPVRGPGRREIGHGALAERALLPVMPSKDDFPYTIRVVSEILESNGSSSMATVCASSLCLMDAGVPISKPVSGIAMGLVKQDGQFVILTDISGLEDHFGDMDFKVTGTKDGLTALQMDVKVQGVTKQIIRQALQEAKTARFVVLEEMLRTLPKVRDSISEFAPRIVTLKIPTEKIRDLIGPGGKTIRKITEDTGVTIDIEEDGTVLVASADEMASKKALEIIKGLTEEPQVGKVYVGKVKRIAAFGAFCEILPGREGLLHISELADRFVSKVEDIVKVGDEIKVKVISVDEQGRVSLSKRQAQLDNHDKRASE